MFFEVILKVLETTSQRRSSTGSESTKRATGPHVLNLFFEDIQIFFATLPRFEIPNIASTHGNPSRQGVQKPQDSWAKNFMRLPIIPTGQV